jgi:undecaprenyl-diphosphatase
MEGTAAAGPSPLHALLLGIVQGLTEFLPVSSSGHLALAEAFLGVEGGGVAFAVLLHAGTLLAIVLVFPGGVRSLVVGGLSWLRLPRRPSGDALFAAKIALATVPGAVVGLLLESRIEDAFSNPRAVGLLLFVTAGLLLTTRRAPGGEGEVGWRDALVIGCAQALAILPGISRSGATISTALLLGIARPRAAEFSFLASLPLILGSVVLELPDLRESSAAGGGAALVIGFAVSFGVGWTALRWLLRLVRTGRLHWFAPYCLAVGLAAVVASR